MRKLSSAALIVLMAGAVWLYSCRVLPTLRAKTPADTAESMDVLIEQECRHFLQSVQLPFGAEMAEYRLL